MEFKIAMHTDIGSVKASNQDSICVKEAYTPEGTVLLTAVCDGMGGLEKGELASKTMVELLSVWFEKDLPYLLAKTDRKKEICNSLDALVKNCNHIIMSYGAQRRIQLGTTVTALLFLPDGDYIICHVGDTRAYVIDHYNAEVLTEDQTLVQREVRMGRLTKEQALTDPRANVLLQCVGASKQVQPVFVQGHVSDNVCYMLCSDGFRHKITQAEIAEAFSPAANANEVIMKRNIVTLIEKNIERGETDNISALLIRTI